MRAPGWLVFAALAASACKAAPSAGRAGSAPTSPEDAAPSSQPATVESSSPAPAPTRTATAPPAPSAAVAVSRDGGVPACRAVRGPIELPLKTPAALALRGDTIDVALNDDGKPRRVSFDAGPLPPASAAAPNIEPAAGGSAGGYPVACAFAADAVFCADRSGAVHRASREGAGDRIIASSRAGSRIAGATLAGKHASLAYLASRQTSEGWVTEAWVAIDDDAPVRLSDDGAGATSIALAARGSSVFAASVDARTALSALHVRPVTYDGRARLGEDVVVFVGGPGERRTALAIALPPAGPAWALLPIAKDAATFGAAHVRVDDPPKVDEPVVWSMYPNGLDPAPIAAAVRGDATWAARVRPESAGAGAARVVELGPILPDGSFDARHLIAVSGKPTDVSLAADARGGLWLGWADAAGSWVERLACK